MYNNSYKKKIFFILNFCYQIHLLEGYPKSSLCHLVSLRLSGYCHEDTKTLRITNKNYFSDSLRLLEIQSSFFTFYLSTEKCCTTFFILCETPCVLCGSLCNQDFFRNYTEFHREGTENHREKI